MSLLARHKRMAAVGEEFTLFSVLNDQEVRLVTDFLKILSFDPQGPK